LNAFYCNLYNPDTLTEEKFYHKTETITSHMHKNMSILSNIANSIGTSYSIEA